MKAIPDGERIPPAGSGVERNRGRWTGDALGGDRHSPVDAHCPTPRPGRSWVIAYSKPSAHLIDLEHPWRRIRALAGLNDVRIRIYGTAAPREHQQWAGACRMSEQVERGEPPARIRRPPPCMKKEEQRLETG